MKWRTLPASTQPLPLLIWPHNQNLSLLGLFVFFKATGSLSFAPAAKTREGDRTWSAEEVTGVVADLGLLTPKSVCTGLNTSSLLYLPPDSTNCQQLPWERRVLGAAYLGWSPGEAPLPGGAGWWPSGPAGSAAPRTPPRSGWPAERPASPAQLSAVGPGGSGCAPSPGWCSAAWTWTSRSHRAKALPGSTVDGHSGSWPWCWPGETGGSRPASEGKNCCLSWCPESRRCSLWNNGKGTGNALCFGGNWD